MCSDRIATRVVLLLACGLTAGGAPAEQAVTSNNCGPETFALGGECTVLVRTEQVDLIVPEDIPWFQPCDPPGDTLWMEGAGDHGIMNGERTVRAPQARFFGHSSRNALHGDRAGVFVDEFDNRTERLALTFVADCVYPDYGRVVGCVNFGADAERAQ
jgi:hypothetical protein